MLPRGVDEGRLGGLDELRLDEALQEPPQRRASLHLGPQPRHVDAQHVPGHLHEVGVRAAVVIEQDRGGTDQTFPADQPDLDPAAGRIAGDRDEPVFREIDRLDRRVGRDQDMPQAHRLGPQSRLQDREILRRESPEEAVAYIGLLEGGHEDRLWGKSTRRPSITSARTMVGDEEKMVFATKTESVA